MKVNIAKIYYQRVRAMSIPEIIYRFYKAFETRLEKWLSSKTFIIRRNFEIKKGKLDFIKPFHDKNKSLTFIKASIFDQFYQYSYFPWQQQNEQQFRESLLSEYPEKCQHIIRTADQHLENHFNIFRQSFDFNEKIGWNTDLLSGKQIPVIFWSDLSVWDKSIITEVKYTWELNRHQFFTILAMAYFITLDEKYAQKLFALWQDWLKTNPPKHGINWTSSLELSLRLISWTWALNIAKKSKFLNLELFIEIIQSVNKHAHFIERHLSRFSSANNHLIGEGLGLIYVGAYFPLLKKSKKWLTKGFKIVFDEIPKQVYQDGVIKEQAIYYQKYIFNFGLHALLSEQDVHPHNSAVVRQRLEKMAECIMYLIDVAGNVPQIGDEDGGKTICLDPDMTEPDSYRAVLASAAVLFKRHDFKTYADKFDITNFWLFGKSGKDAFENLKSLNSHLLSKSFQNGGYHILRSWDETGERVLTFDTGSLGYTSLAAHGHADALSLLLHCLGEPVLIDSGTFLYLGAAEWRDYFKSTAAHNCLTIDGKNQSENIGPFQWGQKARTSLTDYREDNHFAYIEGSVDGFFNGSERFKHIRQIGFIKPGIWLIRDSVFGSGQSNISLHFHLPHYIKLDMNDSEAICHFRKSIFKLKLLSGEHFKIENISGQENPIIGWYSNSFGQKEPCYVIRIHGLTVLPCTVTILLQSVAKKSY